jgi:hypothetical protein
VSITSKTGPNSRRRTSFSFLSTMCPVEQEEVVLPHAVEAPQERRRLAADRRAQDPGDDHQALDLDLRAEAAVQDEGLQQDPLADPSVSRD